MKSHTISENETRELGLLARLKLTDEEHVVFKKDIESILGFIDTIQDVSEAHTNLEQSGFAPLGGMRADVVTTVSSASSAEEIVEQAPTHANNFIKVKKILAQ